MQEVSAFLFATLLMATAVLIIMAFTVDNWLVAFVFLFIAALCIYGAYKIVKS